MKKLKKLEIFDIVVSIFNQENLIEKVLYGIFKNTTTPFNLILVFDGCTDKTKERALKYIEKFKPTNLKETKIIETPNIYETKANNIGFKLAKEKYMVTIQDDMIINEFGWERRITHPLRKFKKVLAVSARFAQDIDSINGKKHNYINRMAREIGTLPRDIFAVRDIINRGPIAFRMDYLVKMNYLNEDYAPSILDEADLCLRAWKNNKWTVGSFWIDYISKIEWGKTRDSDSSMFINDPISKNSIRFTKDHSLYLLSKIKHSEDIKISSNEIDYIKIRLNKKIKNKLYILNYPIRLNYAVLKKIIFNNLRKIKSNIKNILKKNKFTNNICSKILSYKNIVNKKRKFAPYRKFNKTFNIDINFTEAVRLFKHPNKIYLYMHHYFYHLLPKEIRKHRFYFTKENRGFGEDSFHSMWWALIKEFKPKNCLEIGVYRGQTISLWTLIAKKLQFNCNISGISPLKPIGDSVSSYIKNINYSEDIKNSFEYFNLPKASLIKALSTDKKATEYIKSKKWDLVYIDGNHDYETVLADYKLCKKSLSPNGLIVFDDSSLGTSYIPPFFSSAGHPGPSDVVKNYAMKEMLFLGSVGHNNIFKNKQN